MDRIEPWQLTTRPTLTRGERRTIFPNALGRAPVAANVRCRPMVSLPPFMFEAKEYDIPRLIQEWRWLVPPQHMPLLISIFGDWVFGAPDQSHWALSVLEGDYTKIARNSTEFNTFKSSFEWLDKHFIAGWQEIAHRHGLSPSMDQCLGWKIHPLLGGKFEVANLQVFDMTLYQSLMGQLHRESRGISR